MENIIKEYKNQFRKDHQQRRRYACLLGVLALLVCLAVFWRLKLTGTAMTNEATCGLQEHTHTEECYSNVLVCTAATGETAQDGGHQHTEACFERQLVCTIPEHTHTADCYSNADADTETEATWTQSFPQGAMTGDWAQDAAMIASSQVGYTESAQNWQLNEDGTHRGYTRYGAWYGNPYADWNGMFAAFCLHYAGVQDQYLTTANAAGVNAWAVALYQAGQLQGPGHDAAVGDVVFLGSDDKIESCAVVTDVYNENGVTTLSVVAGDVDNTVTALTIPADSASVLGYAGTEDAYTAYEQDHPTEDVAAESDTETPDEELPTDEETTPEDAVTEEPSFATLETDDTTIPVVQAADGVNLLGTYTDNNGKTQDYIHNLEASSVKYTTDKDGKKGFSTKFNMEITIPKDQLTASSNKAYYVLPKDIEITDSMANQDWTDFYDDTTKAGQYRFVKDENGQWRVEMQFYDDYMNSDKVKNNNVVYLQKFSFDAEEYTYTQGTDGKLEFKFSDSVTCKVDPSKVDHPKDETWDYDITTTKSGSFSRVGNKLYYTVTVSSTKGTPDPITVEDTLTIPDGVTVKGRTAPKVVKNNGTELQEGNAASKDNSTYKVDANENKSFKLELPSLGKGESYTITYEYELDNIPANTTVDASNHLKASASDTSKGETVVSEKDITVKINSTILKKNDGWANGSDHTITWTIEVNDAHQDIANLPLTDEMFKQLVDGSLKISACDKDGNWNLGELSGTYTFDKDSGKITFKEVANGENTYKYKIEYKTPYSADLDETITNKADFGDQTDSGTANVSGDLGLVKKADKNYTELPNDDTNVTTLGWTVTITPTNGKIPADWKFTDSMSVNSGNFSHYMTFAQAQEFIKVLDSSPLKDHYKDLKFQVNGDDNNWVPAAELADGVKYTKVEFTISEDVTVSTPLTLHYFTTADATDKNVKIGDTGYFKNSVTIANGDKQKTTEDTTQVFKPGAAKGVVDKNQQTITDKDDTFMWYVKISCAKDNVAHTYVIEDTLPNGVELVGVGVGASKDKDHIKAGRNQRFAFVDGNWTDVTNPNGASTTDKKLKVVSGTQEGQKVTVTVTKPTEYNEDHFFVVFECKLSAKTWDSVPDGTSATVDFPNTATVKRDNETPWTTNTSTVNGTIDKKATESETLTKSGNFTKWIGTKGYIEYTLNVNPEGKKLLEGEEEKELTLTDSMDKTTWPAVAELDRSSVQVFKVTSDGTNVLLSDNEYSVAYDQSEKKLTITLPDQMPLVVKYTYVLSYVDSKKEDSRDFTVTNNAQLNGKSSTPTSDTEKIHWESSSSNVEVGHSYTLIKVDADSVTKCLEGAEFTVYAYNGKEFDLKNPIRTYTTDKNGVLNVSRFEGNNALDYNKAYCLVESKPPVGYEMPTNPQKFYFYLGSSDTEKFPERMPEGFKNGQGEYAGVLDLTKTSKTVYVENERLNADASITKVWAEGTPDEQKNQAVYVDLMRIKVSKQDWENFYNGTNITEPVTLTAKTMNNGDTVQTYQKGTTVHIRYVQGRWDRPTACGAVSFVVNGTTVPTKQTGFAVATTKYNGYDVYEADIKLDADTTITLSGDAHYGNGVEFQIPASSGIGTSTWSDTATERLADLLSKYESKIETVTEGMEVYAGTNKLLYNLPIKAASDADSDRYIYYVKEQSVQGYTAALTMDGYGGDDGGSTHYTFTITNTPGKSYELPKTGGSGTIPYMAGGLALMAVSLLFAYFKKRRGEGRQGR